MNDLGTALRELAGEVTAPHAADPEDLWSRGRSRVRRQRVAAVVTMLVLGALGYVGIAHPTPTVVMPAGTPHAAAIPENIWAPDRFLAGVSETGAPGQLALIASTQNDSNHYYGRWFGISATTGEYVALDLPGKATDSPMWLSPDGAHIAYSITGPTKEKNYGKATDVYEGGPFPPAPPAGLGVYDTLDGSVQRYRTLTDMGWSVNNDLTLSWLDNRTVAFTYSRDVGKNGSIPAGTWLWHPGEGDPRRLAPPSDRGAPTYAPGYPAGTSVQAFDFGGARNVVVGPDGTPTGRTVAVPRPGVGPTAISASPGRTVFGGPSGSNNIPRLQVADGDGSTDAANFDLVGTALFQRLLGWRSAQSVVMVGLPSQKLGGEFIIRDGNATPGLYVDDLRSLTEKRVGTVSGPVDAYTISVASALLGHRFTNGRKPPNAVETWLRYGGVAGLALGLVWAVWVYRRRRPWRAYLTRERERYAER